MIVLIALLSIPLNLFTHEHVDAIELVKRKRVDE